MFASCLGRVLVTCPQLLQPMGASVIIESMTTVVVPDKTKLRLYLQKGMTQKEIVDQWEEESGFRVSRSAIGMAIARYGLESANPRPRFDDLIPWKVRTVHKNRYDLRMLRLEHRRRHGKKLTDDQRKRLTSWRKALDAPQDGAPSGAVIFYNPNSTKGFFWIPREPHHRDIIDPGPNA